MNETLKTCYCPLCNQTISVYTHLDYINCPNCSHHLTLQTHCACETEFEECTETRGDQIRAMSDYDLAWILMDFRVDAFGSAIGNEAALPNSQEKIREWLGQKEKVVV